MISINNISIEFSGTVLFSNVTFNINKKDRIGLAGKNGSGKTTLLRIIAGVLPAKHGEVIYTDGLNVGYLPQEKIISGSSPVIEETLKAFAFIDDLKLSLDKITTEISTRTDYESKAYHQILEDHDTIHEQLRLAEPDKLRGRAEKILLGLGFKHTDFSRSLNEFSFGWQMRVEIAKLLLLKPTLLLLDEPTNHLDIDSIQWLEDYLINYTGSVMIVSHDRTLLDNLTNRTIEINKGKSYDYKVAYSHYIVLRDERVSQQLAAFNNQQKVIRQTERFIERFRYKNTKSKQVQSRIKSLEKMDKVQIDELDQTGIHFLFPPAPHSGKVTVEGKHVSKEYGQLKVLSEIDFQILKGEKVAFVGRNGEGKTTLAKIINKQLPFSGGIKLGHNVITGYFAQDQWEMLDPELTVFETVDVVAVGDVRKRLNAILGAFLFQDDDVNKKVKVLSGGEKSRLALAKLLLVPSNLLIMDEPTNHLDILSKDILKNALLQYNGTIIIVSHDRDFLQGLTTRLYEFKNRKVKEFRGDIFEFLEKRKLSALNELEHQEVKKKDTKDTSGNKQKWQLKKELEKKTRKLENSIATIEGSIEKLEIQLDVINQKLSDPERHAEEIKSGTLYKSHDRLKNEIKYAYDEWEAMSTDLAELESV